MATLRATHVAVVALGQGQAGLAGAIAVFSGCFEAFDAAMHGLASFAADLPSLPAPLPRLLDGLFVHRVKLLMACLEACVNYDTIFTLSSASVNPIASTLDGISIALQSLLGLGNQLLVAVPALLDRVAAICLRSLALVPTPLATLSPATIASYIEDLALPRAVFDKACDSIALFADTHVRAERAARLDAALVAAEATVVWATNQCTRFEWLYGESAPAPQYSTSPQRTTVLSSLFSGAQRLQRLLPDLRAAHDTYTAQETAVRQRLTWAAAARQWVGPATAVGSAMQRRGQAMAAFARSCNTLAGLANAVAHFEAYRPLASDGAGDLASRFRGDDLARLDAGNMAAVASLQQVLQALHVTLAERAQHQARVPPEIVAIAPDGRVTAAWMQHRLDAVPLLLAGMHSEQLSLEHAVRSRGPALRDCDSIVHALQASVARLMGELDPLLQPLVRAGSRPARIAADAHRDLASALEAAAGNCATLHRLVTDGLAVLAAVDLRECGDVAQLAHALLAALAALETADVNITDDGAVAAERVGPRAGQERNAQAASAWRRVRAKLEGRDSEGVRRPVGEQVDALVRDAMADSRLCRMYEGWAPWI